MDCYSSRRRWSDTYMQRIKELVAGHFIVPLAEVQESDFATDTQEATDLLVADKRIAVRVRRPRFARYFGEFTVRTSGAKSELAKLNQGFVDYVFYSFADEVGGGLKHWWLMDANEALLSKPKEENGNGYDSAFRSFAINPNAVKASSEPWPYTIDWWL